MDQDKLRELLEDDDLGLLDVKPKQTDAMSEEERLIESFYAIVEFYQQHQREPRNDPSNIQEVQLAMRLNGLRGDPSKIKMLLDLDEFGLLDPSKPPESIDEIYQDDDLGLLSKSSDDDIFNIQHIPKNIENPDYIAQREPCKDFSSYESLFKICHDELRAGQRKLLLFANEQQIQKGQFFVLKGVLGYVDQVGEKEKRGGKTNARLRCIFENGTESAMLLRSLACELYKDGRRVTEHEDRVMDEMHKISDEDSQSGYIYVLKSLSSHPEIVNKKDLYKIGYSNGSVEERIKHAKDDPTYLMAEVRLVETFECYNLNPQKLELLLHRFFNRVCLELDVFDGSKKRFTPREWFIAPLAVIEEAIALIISGDIIHYKYDNETKLIRRK